MSRQETSVMLGYGGVVLAVVLGVAALMQLRNTEVNFCRKVFDGLIQGNLAIESRIDWDELKAMGVDIGSTYRGYEKELDRAQYRQAFIGSFGRGFRGEGGKLSTYRNWRIAERNDETVTVAVDDDLHGKTLLLTVSAVGPRQLLAIQMQEQVQGHG